MAYKYRDIQQLIDEIKEFHDIEFEYNGKSYSICPVNGIYSVAGDDLDPIDFNTIEDLINNCKIQGKFLRNIILDIEVYLH